MRGGVGRLTIDPPHDFSIRSTSILSSSQAKAQVSPLHSLLFETLGLEVSQGSIFDGITDLKRVTAHLTVFDIGVTVNREVQNHRDLFAAKGTGEGVFHNTSTVPQISAA